MAPISGSCILQVLHVLCCRSVWLCFGSIRIIMCVLLASLFCVTLPLYFYYLLILLFPKIYIYHFIYYHYIYLYKSLSLIDFCSLFSMFSYSIRLVIDSNQIENSSSNSNPVADHIVIGYNNMKMEYEYIIQHNPNKCKQFPYNISTDKHKN